MCRTCAGLRDSLNSLRESHEAVMWLIRHLACLVGWHNWWDLGEGEQVCLDCGRSALHQCDSDTVPSRAASA
jgi:hypothetical protein